MMNNWIPTALALPEEGAPVQFSFNERALVLHGVFRLGAFTSRWSRYLPAEINSWRKLEAGARQFDGDGLRIDGAAIEYDHEDDLHGLPAAFAPTWSERPAREALRSDRL